jgi:ABC-type branched-subunit amino acid transport system permease subunit
MMDRMPTRDRIGFILVGLGAIAFALTPWTGGNYLVRFATSTCLFITMALSWNFIGGYARYPSFATAAFFGLGAYAGAIAQTRGLGVAVCSRVHCDVRGMPRLRHTAPARPLFRGGVVRDRGNP